MKSHIQSTLYKEKTACGLMIGIATCLGEIGESGLCLNCEWIAKHYSKEDSGETTNWEAVANAHVETMKEYDKVIEDLEDSLKSIASLHVTDDYSRPRLDQAEMLLIARDVLHMPPYDDAETEIDPPFKTLSDITSKKLMAYIDILKSQIEELEK